MRTFSVLLFLLINVWSVDESKASFEDYIVVNQSEILGDPKPFEEYSQATIRFCVPLDRLVLVECSNDIGEASIPGEEVLQLARVFIKHQNVLHKLEVGRPYEKQDCENIRSQWDRILDLESAKKVCFDANFMAKDSILRWSLELKAIRTSMGYWDRLSSW